MQAIDPAVDIAIDHRVREFLKALNSGGGKPIEELAPRDARAVLARLQSSTNVELPPAQVSER
jgi:acetyl esterase